MKRILTEIRHKAEGKGGEEQITEGRVIIREVKTFTYYSRSIKIIRERINDLMEEVEVNKLKHKRNNWKEKKKN